jgi:hypothetical protein
VERPLDGEIKRWVAFRSQGDPGGSSQGGQEIRSIESERRDNHVQRKE